MSQQQANPIPSTGNGVIRESNSGNIITPAGTDAKKLAKRFRRVFRGRDDAWGKLEGGCVRETVNTTHVINHLKGDESLGIYPLLDNGTCHWAAVDFDFKTHKDAKNKVFKEALRFSIKLSKLGLQPCYFERTTSGLIHLWLFFSKPVKAKKVRTILQSVANELHLEIRNGEVEIFPKQDKPSNLGNYVNLPYYNSLNGNLPTRRVILANNNFKAIPVDKFLDQVDKNRIPRVRVDKVYEAINKEQNESCKGLKGIDSPSRKKLIQIVGKYWIKGQRQDLALSLSGFLAKNGVDWSQAKTLLLKIAKQGGDNEIKQRVAAAKTTFVKFKKGDEVKGYKGLQEYISQDDLAELNSLLCQGQAVVPWPSPMRSEAYHGLAGEIVRTIEPHSEADSVALLINLLTAFGNVIGNKPFFRVGADRHSMRLFCVLVGNTSKARKGLSWGYNKHFFEIVDPEWTKKIQTGLSSGEGLIWAVRDEIRKKQPVKEKGRVVDYEEVIVEEGIDNKRLLVLESEFAQTLRMLGRDGNVLSPVIRNAWDTGDLQTLTKNSPAMASGAHISIIGHIGRDELLRYLTSTEAGNGFGNRFLWVCVKRSKPLAFGGNFHEVNLKPLIKKFKKAIDFASMQEEITWAKETRPLWERLYPDLSEGKPGLIGALTARAEAYVTRLACIYALLDRSKKIKPAHLSAALAIWEYSECSTKYIFQKRTGNTLADRIQEELKKHPGGMTRTSLNDTFNRNYSSDNIKEALEILKNLGRVEIKRLATNGRPKQIVVPLTNSIH